MVAVEARQLAALAAHSSAVDEFEDAEADMLDLLAMLAGDETGEEYCPIHTHCNMLPYPHTLCDVLPCQHTRCQCTVLSW